MWRSTRFSLDRYDVRALAQHVQIVRPCLHHLAAFGEVRCAVVRATTVVRKLGVKLFSDPYTDKPNVRLYGYQRVGGGIANSEALKFLKFGDS